MIRVVNKKFHTPTPFDFYIGRGSALGNSFTHLPGKTQAIYKVETVEEAIDKCEELLYKKIEAREPEIIAALNIIALRAIKEDVNLVCYCSPRPCHGNMIKKIVEERLKLIGLASA